MSAGAAVSSAMRSPLSWLRARLRGRPDSEHEMMINRLVISTLILTYLSTKIVFGETGAVEPLVIGASYAGFSLALCTHLLARPGVCVPRRYLGMLGDLGMLSYGMHAGGEITAVLYPIYLWTIFGNGFRFGIPYLLASAAIALAGFGLVILTTDYWFSHGGLSLGLLFGLVILPLYCATLIRKLERARAAAEQASRAKSMFLASVSHELRTPLNAIIGMSELLGATDLDEEQADMAHTVRTSGASLLALINDLLDFSRLEAGKMPSEVVEFDLYEALDDVRAMVTAQAAAKDLHLAVHVAPRAPQLVRGDVRHLKEILLNLAGNAVKFTDAGGVVLAVDAVPSEGDLTQLRFEVSDTGIGIAPDATKRIFESFSQADETIINRYGGTGLGLAIAKQLVALMGGEIGVESRPGDGSTFWFTALVGRSAAPAAPLPAAAAVLVVAGDPERADALAASVRELGILPAVARSADEAVATAERLADGGAGRIAVLLDPNGLADDAAALAAIIEAHAGGRARTILSAGAAAPGLPDLAIRRQFVTALDEDAVAGGLAAALRIALGAQAGREPGQASALDGQPRRPLHILIAEDNRTNQKVLSKILERAGHTSTIAENGEEALDLLADHAFDVVLMDVNMPVLDGIEATKLYRFASIGRRRVPVIALTADATPEARERCLEAGMDACASKPIDPRALLALLEASVPDEAGAVPELPRDDKVVTAIAKHPRFKPSSHPALDHVALADLEALGGKDFVNEVVREFVDDAERVIVDLEHAARMADVPAFRDLAHALRSGAANIGAQAIYELCLSWRDMPYDRLTREGPACVEKLRTEFERVRASIDSAVPDLRARKPG